MTKSKTICLRITEEQYNELYSRALASNTVISQFVINSLFAEPSVPSTPIPNLLTVDHIIEAIKEKKQRNKLDYETSFVLSDVFDAKEWGAYFNVVTIGSTFCKLARTEGSIVNRLVEWQGEGNGPARYKLRKD